MLSVFQVCADIVGALGVLIMFYGAMRAAVLFLKGFFHPMEGTLQLIRIELGMYFELGLELLIGKDIIETILIPTYDELGKLAIIVALRLLLSFVLSRELDSLSVELRERLKHPTLRMKRQK